MSVIMLCLGACPVFGQAQQVFFDAPLKPESRQHYSMHEFLQEGVPVAKSGDCTCGGFGFFYFRLNRGKIDSLFMDGTLIPSIRVHVENNLRRSQNFWRLGKRSIANPTWIMYPYFDLGGTSLESPDCDSAQKAVQKALFEFAESLDKVAIVFRRGGSIILSPSKIGGPYIDL